MRIPRRTSLTNLRYVLRAVGGINLAMNVMGVLVLATVLNRPDDAVATGVLVLGLVGFLGLLLLEHRQGALLARDPLLMGTRTLVRIALCAAALAASTGDGRDVASIVAGPALMLMLVGESALRRPMRSAVPPAANIPGWDVRCPSNDLGNLFFTLTTVGTATIVATAVTPLTPWLSLGAAVLAASVAVVLGLQSARYLVGRNAFERNLPRIMKELAPIFTFHWQAPAGTAYQAAMWLPYLDRLGVPYFVLARTKANFTELARLTDAPIILRTRLEDLDAVVCPSLKTVFYANTAVRNSHMIRFPHLTHIQLNHGDSDKIASVSPTFRQYDRNFVAGQAAIDRFALHGVPTLPDQFEVVGRPQLETVERADADRVPEPPTVLYSPTWSGFYDDSDYSSLSAGPQIVSSLLARGCTIVFRPHPYARRHPGNAAACDAIHELLRRDESTTGRAHVFGAAAETHLTVTECFNRADAMVSDVSSLASDFLISSKPFAMAAVSAHGDAFVREFPLARAAYTFDVVRGVATYLDVVLDDMLGPDTRRATRLDLQTYYLGDVSPEHAADRFLEITRRYL